MLSALEQKEHTLNRLGYGQSRWHSFRYDRLGYQGFVDQQLGQGLGPIAFADATVRGKIDRSVLEERQLEAVLIDFWFNHFNIDTLTTDPERRARRIVGRKAWFHQNRAVGDHVLGSFPEMLLATAQSPAMLDYLDNRRNYAPAVIDGTVYGPNENYARELLELHTLGVDGGYDEHDIVDVARVLTGWTVKDDLFFYRHFRHDEGSKQIMSQSYPAGRGIEEGEELLGFLARHPSTASLVCAKLVDRFVAESTPGTVHRAATRTFAATDGDLTAVMRTIFGHANFLDSRFFRSKVKPPHRYVASALLAMGVRTRDDFVALRRPLGAMIQQIGEVPYVVAAPTGYPDRSDYWVSGPAMIGRFEIAEQIAYDDKLRRILKSRLKITGADSVDTIDKVAAVMVPGGLSARSRAAILDHVAANATTNNARVSGVAHLVLCSPEFVRY